MKPSNFPARKRKRQIGALSRLLKRVGPDTARLVERVEIAKLQERIFGNQRDVRTKKDRSAGALMRRV